MESQKRNMLLGGAAVVLFGGAAYLLFSRGEQQATFPDQYTYFGVCLACRQDVTVTHSKNVYEPFDCPNCRQAGSVYGWLWCPACEKRVLPPLVRDDQGVLRVPGTPTCPVCRSNGVGSYTPQLHDALKKGDVLPKWP